MKPTLHRSNKTAKDRELTKLHQRLSIRERQLAACIATLKAIVQYPLRSSSTFMMEAQQLQHLAAHGLCHAHEIQSGKRVMLDQVKSSRSVQHAKLMLNSLYGRWGEPARGSEED